MHYSSVLLTVLTVCAAATDVHNSSYSSNKENMTSSRSSVLPDIFWTNVTAGNVTRAVSGYIMYHTGPTPFAVRNITYTATNSTNITVACPTGYTTSTAQNSFHLTSAPMRSAVGSFSTSLDLFQNTPTTYPSNQQCPNTGTSDKVAFQSGVPCPNVASPTSVPCTLGRLCPTLQAGMQGGVVPAGSLESGSPNSFDTSAMAHFSSGSSDSGAGLTSNRPLSGPGSPPGLVSSMSEADLYSTVLTSTSKSSSGLSFGSTSLGAESPSNSITIIAGSSSSLSGSSTPGSDVVDDSTISVDGSSSDSSFESSSLGSSSNPSLELSHIASPGGSSESNNPIMSSIGASANGISNASGNEPSANESSDSAAISGSPFSSLYSKAPSMTTIVRPSTSAQGSASIAISGTSAGEPSTTSSHVVKSDASAVTGWSIVSLLGVTALTVLL